MKIKRILSLFLLIASLITAATSLSSCFSTKEDGKIRIVCTIFPIYDWVREITKGVDDVSLNLLVNNGVDLHSFQPTIKNITDISSCDVFLYVGGESDEWVKDALKNATNPDMKVVCLLDALGEGVKREQIVEGMEQEHDHGETDGDHEEEEYDEHVWLSLKNAAVLCEAVAATLADADPKHEGTYKENLAAYNARLAALDARYDSTVKAGTKDTLLFADRFPFRYLADDYGLNYYAAFSGCSAESEASFQTIVFLAGKVDALGLTTILTIEGTTHEIAETVKNNTTAKNQRIAAMDSMQSITQKGIRDGATYLSIMEKNLTVLASAVQ